MATSAPLLPNQVTTDAEFRAYAQAIDNVLIAGGFVDPGDAGQVNLATVNRPVTGNTSAGFKIYRSNDASGGLHNFYIRIDYAVGSSANVPGINLAAGWGTDGNGNINSTNKLTGLNTAGTASSATLTQSYLCAKSAKHIALAIFPGQSSHTLLRIGRTKDVTGTDEDQLFLWCHGSAVGQSFNRVLPYAGTIPTGNTDSKKGWRVVPSAAASFAGNYGISAVAPLKGRYLMEDTGIYAADQTNFSADGALVTLTSFGTTKTYVLSVITATGFPLTLDGQACNFLSLYE